MHPLAQSEEDYAPVPIDKLVSSQDNDALFSFK